MTDNKRFSFRYHGRVFDIISPQGEVIETAFTKFQALKRVYELNGWTIDEDKLREKCRH